MGFISLLLIAISLSFDTFAVSISTGIAVRQIKFFEAVKIASTLAFFQSIMPYIGWFAASSIQTEIQDYDHWIAFILLFLLGSKMIYDNLKHAENVQTFNPYKTSVLISMGIATSIDALVVGITFGFLNLNIYWSVMIIGIVTFFASMLGMLFGKQIGSFFDKKVEIFGGFLLILIGLKILIEHLYFR
jgi:putative Mn2+ efflux pump MntP